MPNHIVNHLTIKGTIEQVNQVLEFLKGENGIVDFNKIKPMPEGLEIASSSDGTFGVHYLQYDRNPVKYAEYKKDFDRVLSWPKDRRMEAINLAKKYLANISKYGHDTWYSWSYANWETKWNAYQCEMIGYNTVEFQTAWSGVPKLMSAVVAKFPDVDFDYMYADEDAGYNVGYGYSWDGELLMQYPDGGSDEAFEIYLKTHPWAQDELVKEDGKWQWLDN